MWWKNIQKVAKWNEWYESNYNKRTAHKNIAQVRDAQDENLEKIESTMTSCWEIKRTAHRIR
jgi:hypothetical protein